jgi:hypothetical protein
VRAIASAASRRRALRVRRLQRFPIVAQSLGHHRRRRPRQRAAGVFPPGCLGPAWLRKALGLLVFDELLDHGVRDRGLEGLAQRRSAPSSASARPCSAASATRSTTVVEHLPERDRALGSGCSRRTRAHARPHFEWQHGAPRIASHGHAGRSSAIRPKRHIWFAQRLRPRDAESVRASRFLGKAAARR